MVELTAAEDDPSCEAHIFFFEPVEVFSGVISVNSKVVLDARDDKCCHDRFDGAVWEAVSCVGEAD